MRVLVPAAGAHLEQVLDETYPLWGEGLDRDSYARYNQAQRQTAWGRGHLHRFLLLDGGRWVSTAKRYDLEVVVEGERRRAIGIGAVFTPQRYRGRGYAADLMERLLVDAEAEGFRVAILFSEIAPRFYERLGFRSVPINQVALDVDVRPGPPAVGVRSGEPRDYTAIAEMNRLQSEGMRFALARDPDYIAFAIAKKRLLAGFSQPAHRRVEFFVSEEGGRAAAYVLVFQVNDYWMITECGDRDPSGARVGAMLQTLLARGDTAPKRIRAWLPPTFLPPQLRIAAREVAPLTMMVRGIGKEATVPRLTRKEIAWWHGDAF